MNHFRVIIVGAGPAGISTAARLLEYNVNDILVLEAQERIGGRVFTSEIEGKVVELGAEFIHGETGNIVFELASQFGLANSDETNESIFADTTFFEAGNKEVNKDISRHLCSLYKKIIYAEPNNIKPSISSLGEYFVQEYWKEIKDLDEEVKVTDALAAKFLDVFEKWENTIDASHSWFETSLLGNLEYWECEGNVVTLWRGDGYRLLFDLLEKKPPYGEKSLNVREKIMFNKKVKHIIWNKETLNGARTVTVKCADGTKFTSDYIVLTVSLGVLKEQAKEMFTPSLSEKKLNAIGGLGYGTVDKIFLKFPFIWWTEDIEGFAFLWSDEDKKDETSGWISDVVAFHPIHPDSLILRGWIAGEAAVHFETLSEDEVLEGCMYLLNKFLGFKYKIPPAEVILRSSWYSNPHFRGSYSFRKVESDVKNVWASDLAQPEFDKNGKPVVLFAGEATHDHYYSTVHGAVESGQREADRLLKNIMSFKNLRNSYDVVIIGAGISGLAAAKTLYEEGITDVIILEAQDFPGGRIKSIKIGNDWLELGAQWIHGDKNEVFEICKKHDLIKNEYSQEGEGYYLTENGTIFNEKIVAEIDDLIKCNLEECEKYVFFKEDGNVPISVGDELVNKFNEYLNNCDDSSEVKDLKKDLLYWHIRFHNIDNSCYDLKTLSAKAWGLFRFCGGNDYINFKNGYQSLVDTLIRNIPECNIMCSTPVNVVKWKEHINAEYIMNGDLDRSCDGTKNTEKEYCAEVVCDEISFNTNYVIVTSSLGYLKNNHEQMFRPPLPLKLIEAINTLGYGVLGKIFLIYKEAWWDSDVKGFQLVWSHKRYYEKDEWNWAVDVTGFDVILKNKPILLGWVGGKGAKVIESMAENEVGIEATEILRKFTGNREIPLPDMVLTSKWFNNKFVQGGYSHITVDYDKNGIDGSNLSIPVYTNISTKKGNFKKPTVLLAGEAVHQTHYSTVHGAYESGVSQAHVIVNDIKSRLR